MLSDNDLELLSAYIDGALNESERAALEARLAADADLRRELERLRATVTLVKSLPTLAAPRDFTLTPRMVRRPPTILTSAAFSALSAAAAVVLLIVGAALFTTSTRVPPGNLVANQVALAPTTLAATMQDGAQAEVDEVAREQSAGAGALAPASAQPTQEPPLDLLPAPTGTGMLTESQYYQAPDESATRAEEADNFAGAAAADTAMNTQADGESAGVMQSAVMAPTVATELRMAEPSLPPESAASGMAEAQPPAPGEAPMAFQPLPETAAPAPIIAPTATPTLTPSASPTSTATPTETAALVPSLTPTPTPQPPVSSEADSAGVGIGLILVALVLLLAAVVTTILRRRV